MKSCPTCNRTFEDTFTFCLVDGSILSAPYDPRATQRNHPPRSTDPGPTEVLPNKVSVSAMPSTVLTPDNKSHAAHLIEQGSKPKKSISLSKRIFKGVIVGAVIGLIILLTQVFLTRGRVNLVGMMILAGMLMGGGAILAIIIHGIIKLKKYIFKG